ncbi:MAG: calcium/sodium antiporter [Pseudomonadaceae bacterium]|nr:calcium/sodium antiporter [Pseudomonadaceae bacterium]
MDYIYVLAGLLLLFAGGEGLVRGSVAVAEKLKVSKLLIGMAVVGFGTSAPELMVSVQAALNGQPAVAVGNVVGSNIANMLLIGGVAMLLAPLAADDKAVLRDGWVMVLVTLLILAQGVYGGVIGRTEGALMVAVLACYLAYAYRSERKRALADLKLEEEVLPIGKASLGFSLFAVAGGLLMLVLGADLLVEGAVNIAKGFGVSEAVIGLTLVAVGTSLPELAATLVAAWKKHNEVILGNIIGSNIFNVLSILGITAMVKPVPLDNRFVVQDIPFALLVSVAMVWLIGLTGKLNRTAGVLFMLAYVGYMALLFSV